MRNFTFYSPTFFAFGKDTEKDAGKYVRRFGGTKVLIHYGGGSVVRSGLLDRVKASLEEEGLPYVVLGGVKPNPRSGLVYEGIDLCRKEGLILSWPWAAEVPSIPPRQSRPVRFTTEISGISTAESRSQRPCP